MRKIFISYRRDDADEAAGRLSDQLVSQFGQDNVFMDVDGIAPGRDFRKVIDETLTQCDVMLGVLGRNWLNIRDERGNRRLDSEFDFVRIEIATALRRDIPVIPVRVQGAAIPKPGELPAELKDFAFRNAVELTHERWNSDVQVLVEKLRRLFGEQDKCAPMAHAPVAPAPVRANQAWGSPAASVAVQRATASTADELAKKQRTRKIIKWSLVGFFILGIFGSLGDQDAGAAGVGVLLVAFLIWDPFKWFVLKS